MLCWLAVLFFFVRGARELPDLGTQVLTPPHIRLAGRWEPVVSLRIFPVSCLTPPKSGRTLGFGPAGGDFSAKKCENDNFRTVRSKIPTVPPQRAPDFPVLAPPRGF
jgi:hypothetical protein